MKKQNKYNNRKIKNASGKFDSRLEYHRYLFLCDAQAQGLISGLRKQVPFLLIPEQYETVTVQMKTKSKEVKVLKERPVEYIADFVYEKPDGITVIEDTKSEPTRKKESYIIKRKLMRLQGNPIREVTRSTEDI